MCGAPSLAFLPLPKGHCQWEALLVDPGNIRSELPFHRCDPQLKNKQHKCQCAVCILKYKMNRVVRHQSFTLMQCSILLFSQLLSTFQKSQTNLPMWAYTSFLGFIWLRPQLRPLSCCPSEHLLQLFASFQQYIVYISSLNYMLANHCRHCVLRKHYYWGKEESLY